ncbi:hypothetical protein BPAE_0394g00070 [Botrytis paeoniae]|uniref:Uncharacterized protein n=1 Tax=Botrytis paeoniae TaxID=278948 RepID=A0A4Z1F5W4_9HELO|nr:hypothetical protein BPAE_0394g00070 [Botrytis paeoniae]
MYTLAGRKLYPSIDWMECEGGVNYPKKLPHHLFDHAQRAIWRNLSLWAPEKLNQLMGKASSDPLTLPGPNG